MPTTGPIFPQLAESVSEAPWSDNAWTTPANITADDEATANVTAATFDANDQTHVLKAYNFDFSGVPAGATIDGVIASVNAFYRSGQGAGSLDLMQLLDAARAKVGTNQCATAVPLTTTTTTVITKGSLSDLWGNSLTAAWIKDIDFGIALGIKATAANADVDIDYVTLEIYYTVPPISGALDATLDGVSANITGIVVVVGGLDKTLDGITITATGTVGSAAVSGALDVTLEGVAISSSAAVVVSGALDKPLDDATISAGGGVIVAGLLDKTLDALVSSGAGSVAIAGAASITLGGVVAEFAGAVGIAGALSQTLAEASLTSAGTVAIDGSAAVTFGGITLEASGVVGTVAISGTADITLDDVGLNSAGVVVIVASLAQTLAGVILTATAFIGISLPTPLRQTYTVLPEDRSATILREYRTIVIEAEKRAEDV